MIRALFIFLCLVISVFQLNAEISGVVLDSLSKEPVSGAIIKPIGYGNSAISDKAGQFKLNIPKFQVEVSVNHPDYAEKFIRIKDNSNIKIYLSSTGATTDEIEVTAERHEHFDLNKMIDAKRLESQKSITLAETISELPGISMRSMGPVTARPVIRGLGSYRVSINENGLPVNDLSATSPDHAVTANTGNAQEIQVLTGPDQLEYASSLAGGAINIESPYTDLKQSDELIFDIKTGFESASNAKTVNSGIVVPYKSFSIGATGNYSNTGNIHAPGMILGNTNSEMYDGKAFASYYGKDFSLLINGSIINSDYGIPGGFVGAHPNGVDIEMHQNNAQILANYRLNNIFDDVSMKVKRSYYRHKEFESSGLVGAEFVTRDISSNINLNLDNDLFFDSGKIGMDMNFRGHRYGAYVFTTPADETVFAPYVILNKDISKLHLRFGMRYEHRNFTPETESIENIGFVRNRAFDVFSLSADVSYDFYDYLNLGFTISNSERAPTVDELYKEGPHLAAYSYETGNPDLQNEQSIAYELYMNVTKNKTKMSLTTYVFDFSSFITPRNSGDTNWATLLPIFATSEVPALMAGIDFGIDHNLWKNFWVRSNMNYVYGEITDEESPLPMIPPFNGLLAFEYRSQDFNFGVKSEFASAQNRTDQFEEPTDSYIIFGIDANYNFLFNGVYNSIYFSVENIFDTVYYNHLSRIKSIFPEFGINFRISYKLIL